MSINQSIKTITEENRLEFLKGFIGIPENIAQFLLKNNFSDEQIDFLVEAIKIKDSNVDLVKILHSNLSIEQMKLLKTLYDKGLRTDMLQEFIQNEYTEEKLQEEIDKLPKKIYTFINKKISISERLNKAKIKAKEYNSSK